ncbi:MAG: NCS2 family permease [Candidatus Aminicenantes bacterium]|nr:NCS2 family permease [Candidatus Aminicenantes bacterium]NIM78484.1 NCS2 family permease [Candidatus Aminicenantes bacterium]NIN19905.1 NCS2 family permease [Candidatus Aminicenantes bacterium]NIN41622.1 NCS2 family permease [Candidatus Aminicenantes bacterium]NIN86531.1 NCS2 family permease [Candidatus Aminicenantes bacterium]
MKGETFIQKIFGRDLQTPGKVSISTELVAGLTTFLTMAYIITVNASILSKAFEGTELDRNMVNIALITITCLVSGVVTVVTGILSNTPIAMAPGMGLNAIFVSIVLANEYIDWKIALGIVFIAGFVFLFLTLAGLRKKLVEAIPPELLYAIAVGIGIFIAFIGLRNLGLVVGDPNSLVKGGALTKTVLIGLAGLLTMIVMEILKIRGSLLIGIFLATLLSIILGETALPKEVVSFKVNMKPIFGGLDILGALKLSLIAPIFTMMFIDMFDSVGSLLGLAREADMVDKEGKFPKLGKLLTIDACGTMFGSVCGTSPATTYIESAAGIASGGRTGLTSITTGLLFLLAIIFVPVLAIVPPYATAPALIMVGFFMMKNIVNIDFKNLEIGFPSFLIIIMIALSYSISTGLAFGFLSFTLIKLFRGKFKEVKGALWVINILCLLFLIVETLNYIAALKKEAIILFLKHFMSFI